MCVSVCVYIYTHTLVSSALTQVSAGCIYMQASSIQHSWLSVFLFMNKKDFSQGLPNIKLSVSRLWSQEINAWAASDSVTVHLKNMKENDQNNEKKKRIPEKTDQKLYLKKKMFEQHLKLWKCTVWISVSSETWFMKIPSVFFHISY